MTTHASGQSPIAAHPGSLILVSSRGSALVPASVQVVAGELRPAPAAVWTLACASELTTALDGSGCAATAPVPITLIPPTSHPSLAASHPLAATQEPRLRWGRPGIVATAARGSWVAYRHTTSIPAIVPGRFISRREVWPLMARRAALTADTITAISDGCRAVEMVFLRDGRMDEAERAALAALDTAAGCAAWADWARRQRNSIEDHGVVNLTLERERRELRQRWGDAEPLDAA